ncbi:MAG: tRNA (adenosine(37)-N6)-threonylcarbamoyltransferase complex dimerization subunit type 1 TsaB [Saprospiraceae bacterium]|nr:tRNA (adenosine(37)-N6)-threonylcarbamoyltransferase complex dimerization subunit type 1 TsaB [Saprospiraceae bacterium]
MPTLLAIETTTDICSVAISDGTSVTAVCEDVPPEGHAAVITRYIERCLQTAQLTLSDIDALAVSIGPGSYTGLRVGASVAKGISYALQKPIIGVSTLMALAQAAQNKCTNSAAIYCPMIDARRMEVYTQLFRGDMTPLTATTAKVIDENSYREYFDEQEAIVFCGNGAPKCQAVIVHPQAHFEPILCSAKHLITPAIQQYLATDFLDVAYFEPFYFKAPNITTPKKVLG